MCATGGAVLCLVSALAERGFRFENQICNYRSLGPDLVPFDLGMFDETDLILLTVSPHSVPPLRSRQARWRPTFPSRRRS
jgi:hypothetical protein